MVNSRTKKDLKKNDRNPFEKGNKPNPFAVSEEKEKIYTVPTLKKKKISNFMTVRLDKELYSELKRYVQKNDYALQDVYEVAVSEYFNGKSPTIKEFDKDTTTIKARKDLYIKLRDIKYETQYSQADIFSTAIEFYLRKNK